MEPLDAFLGRTEPAVAWAEGALPPDLERRAGARGLRTAHVAAGRARDKRALLHAVARGLVLPPHFGMNWDALEDALRDLSWLGEGGLLVVLEGAGTLAAASPGDVATLVDVLRAAAAYWRGERRTVLFLLQGAPRPDGVAAVAADRPPRG